VVEYITHVRTMENKIKSIKKKMIELHMINKIIPTLLAKFDHIVVTTEESKNLEKL